MQNMKAKVLKRPELTSWEFVFTESEEKLGI